jgi:hypothetical protein
MGSLQPHPTAAFYLSMRQMAPSCKHNPLQRTTKPPSSFLRYMGQDWQQVRWYNCFLQVG